MAARGSKASKASPTRFAYHVASREEEIVEEQPEEHLCDKPASAGGGHREHAAWEEQVKRCEGQYVERRLLRTKCRAISLFLGTRGNSRGRGTPRTTKGRVRGHCALHTIVTEHCSRKLLKCGIRVAVTLLGEVEGPKMVFAYLAVAQPIRGAAKLTCSRCLPPSHAHARMSPLAHVSVCRPEVKPPRGTSSMKKNPMLNANTITTRLGSNVSCCMHACTSILKSNQIPEHGKLQVLPLTREVGFAFTGRFQVQGTGGA